MTLTLLSSQRIPFGILRRILESQRLSQAYLFKGPEGSGKRTLARRFAQAILCDSETRKKGEPCGECWSCKAFSQGNHPDFYEVQKDGSSIKIKASFDVIKEALTTPYHSRGKVFLIPSAEALTPEAANALLKVIEEPPLYVTFILTSSNIKNIPDTIVSRCQVIAFGAPNEKDVARILEAEYEFSEEESLLWADYSHGSIENAKIFLSGTTDEKGTTPGFSDFLAESDAIFKEILDLSPIELAFKYSKMGLDARWRAILILEARLWDESKRKIDSYLALAHIEKAKTRLGNNVNAFLTLSNMFFDLKRLMREKVLE